MKALIGDRDAIVEVVSYIKHKNGFSISYLDSIGNETGLMYSVSHNIKLLEDTAVEKGLFDEQLPEMQQRHDSRYARR